MAKGNGQKLSDGSALDFEAQLWAAADKMRGHMDASEYKHVCLGLIFLKYISDAFEEKREQLLFGFSDPNYAWIQHFIHRLSHAGMASFVMDNPA
jgi:type I restriction enzyme M protein